MKVLLLADPNSVHTQKWAKSLADQGLTIAIFGLSDYDPLIYEEYPNIQIFSVGLSLAEMRSSKDPGKLKYLRALPDLKKVIQSYQPDIIHAHYATSYGLLGALSGFHPFILSVWGSDVFDFPKKSFLHRALIKYNLAKADKILSTSHVMAKETNLYTNKSIEVTPFGIDLDMFKPMEVEQPFHKADIVIGTVKTLEEKYGIQYLVQAFKILVDRHPSLLIKLLIVGGGSQELYLKNLVKELGIETQTLFTGMVNYNEIPKYHNMLDISIFPSILDSESFGVAVIEASACEKPVIVSNVGGLPEVVEEGVTGLIVPPKDPVAIADSIQKLLLDIELRKRLGTNGRKRVIEKYNWQENVKQMMNIYRTMV